MEIKIKDKELFKKILKINYPYKPEIINFSFDGEVGKIQFKEIKKFSNKEKEIIKAGYSNYGLYFSSDDLIFPDKIGEKKEIKILNPDSYNFFFWEEIFPKSWVNFFEKPLFLFFPDRKVKGFTSISRFFHIEYLLKGKKVFYFNVKDHLENPYEEFLKQIGKEKYDLFIIDHISRANIYSFEKFLFFILKAPFDGYEIVVTQWQGRALPEGGLASFPNFSFSDLLKIFCFPEIEKNDYLKLIEEYSLKYENIPGNMVCQFLKKIGVKEKEEKEKRSLISFNEKKVKENLKKGKLFEVYHFLQEIKKDEKLNTYLLLWQGDWETLFLLLKKPEEDLMPVLFLLGWDGIVDFLKLKDFLPSDVFLLLKDRKKDFLQRLKNLIEKNDKLSFYLKLIYADKLFSSGLKEGENIFKEILKEKNNLEEFELAQLYRFLSYFYFYKGEIEKAIEYNLKWIKISEENGWLWQMPLAFNDLSVIYLEEKNFEKAKRCLKAGLNFSIFLSEEKKENIISFNLGVIYTYLFEFQKAKKIFKKLEEDHRKNNDIYSLIFDLYELSRVNYLEGNIEESNNILNEIGYLLNENLNHPRYHQYILLKTKVSLWLSKEEYKKSLLILKNLENFPQHLEEEREEILSKGEIGGFIDLNPKEERKKKEFKILSSDINSIEGAIKILEIKRICPENVGNSVLKKALSFLEEKGLKKWEDIILKGKKPFSLEIFEIFKEEKIDYVKISFPFKIVLKDGSLIEKGKDENFVKISFPDEILLFLPEDLAKSFSEEIWYAWVYSLIYKTKEEKNYPEKIPEEIENFNGFYYSSYKMKKIIEKAKKLAKSEIPIHIYGETGTGKEVLAKAIHQESKRFYGPFVPVNCSAVPENLFESEFFGWKKGAFTGALMDKPGYFEQADKGTLFLDEIGELPLNLQAKLLRVLQEKEIQRLGDIKRKSVDFRLITATNKDLKKLMEEGKFREDLYYRIVVSQIYLPPLRERKEEIISLSNLIISKNLKNFDLKSYKIDPFFYKAIEERDWKGNVRELENYIVSIMANLEEGGIISLKEGFSQKREETYKLKGNYHQILNDFKKQIIEEALKKAKNNRKEAAKLLGITPQALGYIIRELKMVK